MHFDVVIVGGGIVGLSTAHQLQQRKPDLKIAVLEKENALARHQSSHNSGVMHSGIYYKPGSLRARNCSKGLARLKSFCDRHNIPYEICGKLIVATDSSEIRTLEGIYDKGIKNGLEGLRIIDQDEAREVEPHVNCIKAIIVPQAGIISYETVAQKYAELFRENGGSIFLNFEVRKINSGINEQIIESKNGDVTAKKIICCAGLFADKLALLTGNPTPHKILPFRGEYYVLKKEKEHLVNHLIYPVPDINFPFLGVHYTRMISGGIEAGPNAVLAYAREGYKNSQIDSSELIETLLYPGFRKLAKKFWRTGLGEIRRSYSQKLFVKAMQKLIPEISEGDVERGGSGVRAMACDKSGNLVDDFLITQSENVINVINAPSPAATASLAIGSEIVNRFLKY